MCEKSELRKTMSAMRVSLSPDEKKSLDDAICENALRACAGVGSVLLYSSVRGEVSAEKLVEEFLSRDVRVYFPKVLQGEMFAAPAGPMKKGTFGIEEPLSPPYFGDIDIALVPLLALNVRGFRLGFGGGYYDRFFAGKKIKKVGLSYSFQMNRDFKEDAWDIPMDAVITEKGAFIYGKGQ
ncbi:MAG: 5-formyltetrahydrofolate cyclo-ligase [Clostridia bacterium]|nr:5-formyltetrahydrofolate cyclo-ligase [Clostridia bacterium]